MSLSRNNNAIDRHYRRLHSNSRRQYNQFMLSTVLNISRRYNLILQNQFRFDHSLLANAISFLCDLNRIRQLTRLMSNAMHNIDLEYEGLGGNSNPRQFNKKNNQEISHD